MTPIFDRFLFGGDYNPEQWPRDTWEHDLDLLDAAHINEATVNVFSWSLLQPDEATYDFSTLDAIMDSVADRGWSVTLATGTAAVPAWLATAYPQAMRVDIDGRRQLFGGRHDFCPSSPDYRRLAQALASRVAERYAHRPEVVCWHVNNEYGNAGGWSSYCFCDECARRFRTWLEREYGTLETLNEAWCTNFWSHTITAWDQVIPPVLAGDAISPDKCVISGLQMDYRRFQDEQFLDCFRIERDAIREHDRTTPITTNLMGTYKDFDYFAWGREMDVVSWDNYPGMDTQPSFTAMCHDLMRGVGGGKLFMLMEQTPNQQNWFPYCKAKRPGEVGKLSWQAVAHGADTVQFFQLKQSRGGCERFHGAVIGHDDSDRSRTYREIQALGADLESRADAIMGSTVPAKVAVIFDWSSYWSLEGCVGPTQGLRYPDEVHRFYRALWRRGVAVDMIESTTPLERLRGYDLVVAPALIMVKPGVADTLERYVRGGGRFVTGYMAGIHDVHDLVVEGGYPGELRGLTGVWVEEIDALAPDAGIDVTLADGTVAQGGIVASVIETEGARAVATYGGSDFYAGTPAVTVNDFGDGRAWFVGTALDEAGMQAVIDPILADAGVETLDLPDGIEVGRRVADDGTVFTFAINVGATPVDGVRVPGVDGALDMGAFAVRVFADGEELAR